MSERVYTPEDARRESCRDVPAPHGYSQWKGGSICMDLRCECGKPSHIDAGFVYYVRCPHCARVYALDSVIRLLPIHEPAVWPADHCEPKTARP